MKAVTVENSRPNCTFSIEAVGIFFYLSFIFFSFYSMLCLSPCFMLLSCTLGVGICWTGRQIVCPFPGGMLPAKSNASASHQPCSVYANVAGLVRHPCHEMKAQSLDFLYLNAHITRKKKLNRSRPPINRTSATYCHIFTVRLLQRYGFVFEVQSAFSLAYKMNTLIGLKMLECAITL